MRHLATITFFGVHCRRNIATGAPALSPRRSSAALRELCNGSVTGMAMYANPDRIGKATRAIAIASTLNFCKIPFHHSHDKAACECLLSGGLGGIV